MKYFPVDGKLLTIEQYTILSTEYNGNLFALAGSPAIDIEKQDEVHITLTGQYFSNSASLPCLRTGSWPAGVALFIYLEGGEILGRGGNGGGGFLFHETRSNETSSFDHWVYCAGAGQGRGYNNSAQLASPAGDTVWTFANKSLAWGNLGSANNPGNGGSSFEYIR